MHECHLEVLCKAFSARDSCFHDDADSWHLFQDDVPDLNRRLMSIECQLKKSELSRKHLEVTNKKLLVFAQVWILISQPLWNPKSLILVLFDDC